MKRFVVFVYLFIAAYSILYCQEIVRSPKVLEQLKVESQMDIDYDYYIIDFWATWCPNCIKSLSYFNHLSEQCRNINNISFVAVNSFENSETIATFLRNMDYHITFVIDSAKLLSNYYKINLLPTSIIVDKNGVIIWRGRISSVDDDMISNLASKNILITQKSNLNLLSANIEICYKHDTSFMEVTIGDENIIKFHNKDLEGILANLLILQSDYDFNYVIENAPLEPFLNFKISSSLSIDSVSLMAIDILKKYFLISYTTIDTVINFHKIFIDDQKKIATLSKDSRSFTRVNDNIAVIQGKMNFIIRIWERTWGIPCLYDNILPDSVYRVKFPVNNVKEAMKSLYDQGLIFEQEIRTIQYHKIMFQ